AGLAAALLAGAVVLGVVHASPHLSRSDRNTLDAVLGAAGGPAGVALVVAGAAAAVTVATVWRGWPAAVAAGRGARRGVGAVRAPCARRAGGGRAPPPPPAALAFWGDPARPTAVSPRRPPPAVGPRDPLPPGLPLIAVEPAYRALARAGAVGPPLLRATGRTG